MVQASVPTQRPSRGECSLNWVTVMRKCLGSLYHVNLNDHARTEGQPFATSSSGTSSSTASGQAKSTGSSEPNREAAGKLRPPPYRTPRRILRSRTEGLKTSRMIPPASLRLRSSARKRTRCSQQYVLLFLHLQPTVRMSNVRANSLKQAPF